MEQLTNPQRAEVLTAALPYIKKYSGKIIVVKCEGSAMDDPQLRQQFMEDIALLWLTGVKVVLIHDGKAEIAQMLQQLGKAPMPKVVDKETIEIMQMVLTGKVNKDLVNLIQTKGGHAVGLSGIDGGILEATAEKPAYGFVGRITKIRTQPITDLLEKNYVPVICTLASDRKGNVYTIDSDIAAACIAGSLSAERLILMSDVGGICTDKNDPSTLLPHVSLKEAQKFHIEGKLDKETSAKIGCCIKAISHGVQHIVMIDGGAPHSILMELLTDEGAGTMVTKD